MLWWWNFYEEHLHHEGCCVLNISNFHGVSILTIFGMKKIRNWVWTSGPLLNIWTRKQIAPINFHQNFHVNVNYSPLDLRKVIPHYYLLAHNPSHVTLTWFNTSCVTGQSIKAMKFKRNKFIHIIPPLNIDIQLALHEKDRTLKRPTIYLTF